MVEINMPKTQAKHQEPWGFTRTHYAFPGGPVTGIENEAWDFFSTDDLLTSSNHPGFNKGKRGDIGGAFHVVKRHYEGSPLRGYAFDDITSIANGPQVAFRAETLDNGFFPLAQWNQKSISELEVDGSQAISTLIPTAPQVNLMTMLGEFFSEGGLPTFESLMSLKSRANRARNAGRAYLEADFGWAPLLRDVNDILYVVHNQQKLIDQYVRNAGRRIKRRYDWPVETDSSYTTTNNAVPVPRHGFHYEGYNVRTNYVFKKRIQWLEACFTYSLPDGIDKLSKLARQEQITNYLYGTRITPEVLWNLAPWSWAIDWFTNLGGFFKNVSELNSNGLVLEYAYIMEHIVETKKYDLHTTYKFPCNPKCSHPKSELRYQLFKTERKRRIPVGPYNVGWTFDGLSPDQIRTAIALAFART